MTARTTERDMLNLLLERYTAIREGTFTDRWVRAEHVHSGLGYTDGSRIADFVVADRHQSTVALHGHEVKVPRADWLNELKDPSKADAIKRYMTYWWLVVPDAALVKPGELPEDWGLMVITSGKLRAKKKAPRLDPMPAGLDFTISLMSAAAKTAHREPLRRDAPVAYVKNWAPKCGLCGTLSPCAVHQPRAPKNSHSRQINRVA